MSTALVAILLLAAQPSGGCCTSIGEAPGGFRVGDTLQRHVGYHQRLYYGHYDRHPFDYRFQFDYPWQAGPSQADWPIRPLPPQVGAWHDVEFHAQRPASPRVTIAKKTAAPARPTAANRTTLKLLRTDF